MMGFVGGWMVGILKSYADSMEEEVRMSTKRMIVCERCRMAMMPNSGKFCKQCLEEMDREKSMLKSEAGGKGRPGGRCL